MKVQIEFEMDDKEYESLLYYSSIIKSDVNSMFARMADALAEEIPKNEIWRHLKAQKFN